MTFPGRQPVHETGFPDEGKTDISTPVSAAIRETVLLGFADAAAALTGHDGPFVRDIAVAGSLNFRDWGFVPAVNERRNVKRFTGMRQDISGDRTR